MEVPDIVFEYRAEKYAEENNHRERADRLPDRTKMTAPKAVAQIYDREDGGEAKRLRYGEFHEFNRQ